MIFNLLLALTVFSSFSQAEDNCFDEKGIRAKASEINTACKKDLPTDKEKCTATYSECVAKAISLAEHGKYDEFITKFSEFVGKDIKDKFSKDADECAKKSSAKKDEAQTVDFLTCFQAALIKLCPSAKDSCEKVAEDLSNFMEKAC